MIAVFAVGIALATDPTDVATPAKPVHVTRLARAFVNPWVIECAGRVVIVDAHYEGASRWLLRKLARAGVEPTDVSAIIVTHGHSDHAGGVVALRAVTGAPVIVGAGDVPMVAAGENPPIHTTSPLAVFAKTTIDNDYPPFVADVVVTEPLDLAPYGLHGTVAVVGGHTPGSLVIRLDSGEVFVGDLVRGRIAAHRKPVEHFFQPDVDDVHGVLRRVIDAGGTTIYPGHGDAMAIGDVEAWLDRQE